MDEKTLKLKDEWKRKFSKATRVVKGDYIGVPLSEITAGQIHDLRDDYGEEVYSYPYCLDLVDNKNTNDDMIVILQYLGNGEFLELISNHIILCNDGELVPVNEVFDTSKTAGEFLEKVGKFKENPLMISTLADYAYPLSDDLKILYYNTTFKKPDVVVSKLDKLKDKSGELIISGFKEVAAKDHEQVLKKIEAEAIKRTEHPEILEVDKFIESRSKTI